jgi:hypothetical protein
MLEWVPAGLNTGALSGAKASSSRTRDRNLVEYYYYYGLFLLLGFKIYNLLVKLFFAN